MRKRRRKKEPSDFEVELMIQNEKSNCPGRFSGHCNPQLWEDFIEILASRPPVSDIDQEWGVFLHQRSEGIDLCTYCENGVRFNPQNVPSLPEEVVKFLAENGKRI